MTIWQVYFHEIPEEVIDNLVMFIEVHFSPLHWAKYEGEKSTFNQFLKTCDLRKFSFRKLMSTRILYEFSYLMGASQIDDGVTFNVAGGLMLEHPLTLPFVDAVVSVLAFLRTFTLKSISHSLYRMWVNPFFLCFGRLDQVTPLWDFPKLLQRNSYWKLYSCCFWFTPWAGCLQYYLQQWYSNVLFAPIL